MFIQFYDGSETKVKAVFCCAQDPDDYPHQGELDESDPRYIEFITPQEFPVVASPVDKLKAFLEANPDVAAILG